MISLIALSAAYLPGCWRSAVVPDSTGMGNVPNDRLPGVGQLPPNVHPRLSPGTFHPLPPAAIGNPWKPNVPPRDWNAIVIHHTATSRGSVESIHETHLKRKDGNGNPWRGIGYHFVIGNGNGMNDGEIEPTFRWRQQLHGAHAGDREYNERGIGIALVGNFDREPPTERQLSAVKLLVGVLKTQYDIDRENVVGHREIKSTACPGRYFPMAEVSRSFSQRVFGRQDHQSQPTKLLYVQRDPKR